MSILGFERETVFDLMVNVVPLLIILFFVVGFAVFPLFGFDPVITSLQYSLLIVPFAGLALLTYFAGRAIERSENSQQNPVE